MRKKLKTIGINYIVFCTLILSIELILQLLFWVVKGVPLYAYSNNPDHNKVFEIHPYLVGRLKSSVQVAHKEKQVTTTSQNTRYTGAQPTPGSIRVGVFGGSTTFCSGLTDEDSWPARLQQQLGTQYSVINYGVPGYSTAENIIQMALIAPKDSLDVALFYEGWNDIRNYHEQHLGADYYTHGMQQYGNLRVRINASKFDLLKDILVSFRIVSAIRNQVEASSKKGFKDPDTSVDSLYTRNLQTLKLLSEHIGAQPIFIPQVLNDNYYLQDPKQTDWWSEYILNESMPELMDRFNGLMKNSFASDSTVTIIHSILEVGWDDEHFLGDGGHFSLEGSQIMSEIVAKEIKKL